MGEAFWLALGAQRRALVAWSIGLGGFGFISVLAYPAATGQGALARWWDGLPEAFRAVFAGLHEVEDVAGYLERRLFAVLPLLLAVHVFLAASRALAGAEQTRLVDALLALPIARGRFVLAQAVAIATGAAVVVAVASAALLAGVAATGADVRPGPLALAAVQVLPLAWLLGAIALLLSAWLHGRRSVLAVSFGLLALAYLLHGLGLPSIISQYEASRPLTGEVAPTYLVGHAAAAIVLTAVAAWSYRWKDLRGFT